MAAVEVSLPETTLFEGTVRHVRGYQPLHREDYTSIAIGSTTHVWPHFSRPGVVIKAPHSHEESLDLPLQNKYEYCAEAAILQSLGSHPRIVEYSLTSKRIFDQCSSHKVFRTCRSTTRTQGLSLCRDCQRRRIHLPDHPPRYNRCFITSKMVQAGSGRPSILAYPRCLAL